MPSLKFLKQIAPMIGGNDADIEIAATFYLNASSPKVKVRLLESYIGNDYAFNDPEYGVFYKNVPYSKHENISKFEGRVQFLLLEEIKENLYKISKNK